MPGAVNFTATEKDYVAANLLWHKSSVRHRYLFWIGIVGTLLGILNTGFRFASGHDVMDAMTDSSVMFIFGLFCLVMRMLTPAMLPRQVRKMMQQNTALHDPIHASWDDEAVNMTGSNGTAHLRWDRLHRWLADDRTFVFLQTDRLMFIIPTRALSDAQISDLHATTIASGLRKR